MAKSNVKAPRSLRTIKEELAAAVTHEGAPAHIPADNELLKRLVLSCLLGENNFYVNGKEVASQIMEVTQRVAKSDPNFARALAVEARTVHNLRHAPLQMLVALAKAGKLDAATVYATINRVDEMGEVISLYAKANGQSGADVGDKLSKALQKGIAQAFTKFDEYQLAKYNRGVEVNLKRVINLTHPKPLTEEQGAVWERLLKDELKTPDTWEVGLSAGKDKKETFERLLRENKLGYMALLMNLKNMREAGVDQELVFSALRKGAGRSRILPFQFLSAARMNPQWESVIEEAMLQSLAGMEKLTGKTVFLVDVSGSMSGSLSAKSQLNRLDGASALAMLLREVCENVTIYTFESKATIVPDRRGFALRDAIGQPRGGTDLGAAVTRANKDVPDADRLIIFTDEQSQSAVGRSTAKKSYIMNVADYKAGVGYDKGYVHISGFSESVVKFIYELERGE